MHSKSCYLYFIRQQTLKVTLNFNYKSLSLHFISGLQKNVSMYVCLYLFIHTNICIITYLVVVTTKLMFLYSFTRVNDEFYEGRGHKLSRTDGRCNSLRRWMATRYGGNRDRPGIYTCKAKLNSCLVFAIKSASHRVERQFF